MIIYIGNKWFDTDKLIEIGHTSRYYEYYKSENGNLFSRSRLVVGDDHGYRLIEKDSKKYKELQKHINPNPEDEL